MTCIKRYALKSLAAMCCLFCNQKETVTHIINVFHDYYGTHCIYFSEINKMTKKKSTEVKYPSITDGA